MSLLRCVAWSSVCGALLAMTGGCGGNDESGGNDGSGGNSADSSPGTGGAPGATAQGALVVMVGGGTTCPAVGISYSAPSGPEALNAIVSTGGEDRSSGVTYRVVDGEDGAGVSCTVRASGTDTFEFEAALTKTASIRFSASGTLTTTGGSIAVSEWDNSSGLEGEATDDTCTVDLVGPPMKYVGEGAVWASFTCPHLSDGSTDCQATGTFIFENCEH